MQTTDSTPLVSDSAYQALETLPLVEAQSRMAACRAHLSRLVPQAGGLLLTSRLNIYYLTGTLGNGLLWLPLNAAPVLLLRKGMARARMESPLEHIVPYRSFADIAPLCEAAGSPLCPTMAVEMGAMSWAMARLFQARVPHNFVPGDAVISLARSVKSPWELDKLREAGRRQRLVLEELLPEHIHAGMTENEIARQCINLYLAHSHGGMERMSAPGEEVFFGHIAAADSGNYPHYYNGPMGFRGIHPALPCLGSQTVWQPNSPLCVDFAFSYQGYITDKTQCYWPGAASSLPLAAQKAFELCQAVQEQAASQLRPGVLPSAIWSDTLALVADFDRAEKTTFAQGFMGLGENQVPFLGHSIGLSIDEQPVIAHKFDAPLEQGMVLALEPKIGLPGWGMVGIENTFEISPLGGQSLTGQGKLVALP